MELVRRCRIYFSAVVSLPRVENLQTHSNVNAASGLYSDVTGVYAGSTIAAREISGYQD